MGENGPRPVIVWFRRDLRTADNPALAAAARSGAPVVPLYVLDEAYEGRAIGGAARWWLDKSLRRLAGDLRSAGSPLVLRRGRAEQEVLKLADEIGAAAVHWNRLHTPEADRRDEALAASLDARRVQVRAFTATLLQEPGSLVGGEGRPYRVFTPFFRALRSTLKLVEPLAAPQRLRAPDAAPASEDLQRWGLHPTRPDWSTGFSVWTPGEAGALARLDAFVSGPLGGYDERRDLPGTDGTSGLSPHLHWGEISPARVWRAAVSAAEYGDARDRAVEKFLAELGWREFSHHLLAIEPELKTRNFRPEFDRFPWRTDAEALHRWRRGETGYPIVDAGMRQLWSTGWMHNRVRMIVASFLVKHLLIDWRQGEAWFWDTLVDADEAANSASWQWVAGSGADAAPYFRIFNPVTQGETFDPDGRYVRRWAPELGAMPADRIHCPWAASPIVLRSAGVELGATYPAPIVDHGFARKRALAAFAGLKTP